MIVSIHQPNFFPWLGYFHKILHSDAFVYLDHVENNPRTSTYIKTVQVIANGSAFWLTIPLKNSPGKVFEPINQMLIQDNPRNFKKILSTVELNYKKHPFFTEVFPIVEGFFNKDERNLATLNFKCIEEICKKLDVSIPRYRSSSMNLTGSSTEMLVQITATLNGTAYLCGAGATNYQEDGLFLQKDIQVKHQHFKHPVYPQKNSKEFIKGLSIIDAAMNLGFEGVKNLLTTEHP